MLDMKEITRFNQAESYPSALLVYEAHGDEKILFANRALVELFECESLEEFMDYTKGTFRNIVHPDDLDRVEESIVRQISSSQKMDDSDIKYVDDYVDYRIITKKFHVVDVEDTGRLVSTREYGDIFYVYISDKNIRERQLAFQEFLDNAKYNSTDTTSPDYHAFIVWNLTQNSSYFNQSGLDYIPDEYKDKYTYDFHFKHMLAHLVSEGSKKEALENYTRERLLECFNERKDIKPFIANYNRNGTWSRIRSRFTLMEDPNTHDVYLKIQNQNAVDNYIYEKLFEGTVKDVFDSIILVNFELNGLLVIDGFENKKPRRSQQLISECVNEIKEKTGLNFSTVEELEKILVEKTENNRISKWTFEAHDGFYYHVTLKRNDIGNSTFTFGIMDATTDVTEKMEKDREDYRNKSMFAALASEYVTVSEIDIPTRTITGFKTAPASLEEVNKAMETGRYDYVQEVMLKTSIDPEYINVFKNKTSIEYMKQRLQEVSNYYFIYKASFGLYIEVKVVRADGATTGIPNRVLLAFANKDKATREKLASEHDELTGLYNRRMYEKTLANLKKEYHESIQMICMDLNGLKYMNDNFGHLAGDELIKGGAECILKAYGDIGMCFRIGCDEFEVIILDKYFNKDELRNRIKLICKEWKGTYTDELTMSVGISSTAVDEIKTIGMLIEEADTDMYADKRFYYTQKGNEVKAEERDITKSELANRIFELKTMFDTVRMVDVETHETLHYDADGTEHREKLHCFAIWGKKEPCVNCTTASSLKDHKKHSKFELKPDGVYMQMSQYIVVDGSPVLLEVIHKMQDTTIFNAFTPEKLKELIDDSNKKACEENE